MKELSESRFTPSPLLLFYCELASLASLQIAYRGCVAIHYFYHKGTEILHKVRIFAKRKSRIANRE